MKHEAYILYLYSHFKLYCQRPPKTSIAKLNNKIYYSVTFDTLTNEIFNDYHEIFYVNKIKIIPKNIGDLLTARGLACWAIDDGSSDRSGFIFHTNCYTKEEVELLVKVIKDNFDLNCSIHTRNDRVKPQYLIYVKADSHAKFVNLVSPYFHPSIMYKLTLRGPFKKCITGPPGADRPTGS